MLNVKDIPQELLDRIKLQFDSEPKVQELRVQQQMMMRTGKYDKALDLAQRIEYLYNKCVYEYMAESERQVEQMDASRIDMPVSERERMMKLFLVLFMCADIMKSSVQDIDSILYKYANGYRIDMFDDMKQLMGMCESKLSFLQKNSDYLKDLVWGEKCDNMFDMMLSKAGSIMRKHKNDPNWGKNTEKFNK